MLLIGAGILVGLVAVVGVVVASGLLTSGEPAEPISLQRPGREEMRPDHLPDGTPVWVIGHQDGSVDVLSGFDTHTPLNLGKLNWWCVKARTIENPAHGSTWDEYGAKISGPAPSGLPSWEVSLEGSGVMLGSPRPAPPLDAPFVGPPPQERGRCIPPEDELVYHTFDGWRVWESPTEAVASAPAGWILLSAGLTVDPAGGGVFVCSLDGCGDSVPAPAIERPPPDIPGGAFPGTRYIARVRDGALTDLTQIVFLGDVPR
jgi:hypothetical protein